MPSTTKPTTTPPWRARRPRGAGDGRDNLPPLPTGDRRRRRLRHGGVLAAFRERSCGVHGLEYAEAGLEYCRRRGLPVRKFKIGSDAPGAERYDLAVSFEVAEHLPPWLADKFVDLLCALAPIVVMSAATPGQGGVDHVNEQPHSYWAEKFRSRSYDLDAELHEPIPERLETSSRRGMVLREHNVLRPTLIAGAPRGGHGGDCSRNPQDQANGLPVARSLHRARPAGLERDATGPGRKPPLRLGANQRPRARHYG